MRIAVVLFCVASFSGGFAQVPALGASSTTSDPVVGTLLATDASLHGSVVLASGGTSLLSGTSVDTGSSAATIALKRGGSVRVCPSSSVSVSATGESQGSLMLSLSAGTIEAAYPVGTNADAIVTPDFRIMLAGPANFNFAIGTNVHGDTCVKPDAGNSGAIFISELLGGGSYQVKPNVSVLFREGKVANAAPLSVDCGCPAPLQTEIAATQPASAGPTSPPAAAAPVTPARASSLSSETAPVAPPQPGQTVVQVDAPFVFNAVAPGPPLAQIATLRFQSVPALPLPQVEPPKPPQPKPQKKGIFGRIGHFFSSWFHHKSPPASASSSPAVVE